MTFPRIELRQLACAAAVSLLCLGLLVGSADASSGGIFDKARTVGCNCHGGLLPPNTTTQLVIDGLPTDTGYVPGETYELTVYVLGVAIPAGPSLFTTLAGFNLDASDGRIERAPEDRRVQTVWETECELRQQVLSCNPSTTCGIKGEELCRTADDCFQRRCTSPGTGECRLCRNEIARVQATHTAAGGTEPAAEFTDGNSIPIWTVFWTAPSAGAGAVTFYMAGNVVNGNDHNDEGDIWSMGEWVVPQAP